MMIRYFSLQLKRLLHYIPGIVLSALILLGSLFLFFNMTTQAELDCGDNQKIQVAMTGDLDDNLMQIGLSALTSFDSSNLSLDILTMTGAEGKAALSRGTIAAYVVVPEGFLDEAMRGNLLPLNFVSTVGASGVVSIFKTELTQAVTQLVLSSQKGVYGMMNAVLDKGYPGDLGGKMDALSLVYVDYILQRDALYSLEEMGIQDNLGLFEYLLCGLFILFLLLMCLPFAPLVIRRDHALGRMLAASHIGIGKQTLCEFTAFFVVLAVIPTVVFVTALPLISPVLAKVPAAALFWYLLPVTLAMAAFGFMLYTLSSDLIGGIMLQFFVTLSMCFISGCMYPVYFFPASVQKLALWLPTGIARTQLSCCFTGESPTLSSLALFGYAALFLWASVFARTRQIGEVRQ